MNWISTDTVSENLGKRIFMQYDNHLERCHDDAARALENLLVRPIRMALVDLLGNDVVVAEEHDADSQNSRVLIGSRVTEHYGIRNRVRLIFIELTLMKKTTSQCPSILHVGTEKGRRFLHNVSRFFRTKVV